VPRPAHKVCSTGFFRNGTAKGSAVGVVYSVYAAPKSLQTAKRIPEFRKPSLRRALERREIAALKQRHVSGFQIKLRHHGFAVNPRRQPTLPPEQRDAAVNQCHALLGQARIAADQIAQTFAIDQEGKVDVTVKRLLEEPTTPAAPPPGGGHIRFAASMRRDENATDEISLQRGG